MVTWKQGEEGDSQTAGLRADVITVCLRWSAAWPSELRFFPFLCHQFASWTYLSSCSSIGAGVIVNKECQREARPAVPFCTDFQSSPTYYLRVLGWHYRNRSSETWLISSFKNTSTMQSAISVFWHSFLKEMLKAKKVSCHENDINIS